MSNFTNELFPLVVWRDSVCAGDDGDAPHEKILHVQLDGPLDALVERLLTSRYLASISGGQATWILEAGQPLAVVAQQWTQPRYLVSPDSRLANCIQPESWPHLNFSYRCQIDPEQVFGQLSQPAPSPVSPDLK